MPGLKLTVSGAPDEALSRRLAAELTALTCTTLRKKPERTMVQVRYLPHEHWFIAARSLADHGKNSFRLELTITEGTNTPEEKARYIAAAMAMLRDVLGPAVPKASYVVLHDIAGEAWGYDGVTQAARRLARAAA